LPMTSEGQQELRSGYAAYCTGTRINIGLK
jgi:hypothetical protein